MEGIYSNGVVQDEGVRLESGTDPSASVFRAVGIYDFIVPNLEYDQKTTELVRSESSNQVSTTQGFVSAGQLIVSEGEIVTAEVAQILDSYKVEFENSMGYGGPKILFWLGSRRFLASDSLKTSLTGFFAALLSFWT